VHLSVARYSCRRAAVNSSPPTQVNSLGFRVRIKARVKVRIRVMGLRFWARVRLALGTSWLGDKLIVNLVKYFEFVARFNFQFGV